MSAKEAPEPSDWFPVVFMSFLVALAASAWWAHFEASACRAFCFPAEATVNDLLFCGCADGRSQP